MPPLSLSDAQMDAVMRAAQPLSPADRADCLQAVADLLQGVRQPGDGDVFRAGREAQRRFLIPPRFTDPPPVSLKRIASR
jgi:hypothetical protein